MDTCTIDHAVENLSRQALTATVKSYFSRASLLGSHQPTLGYRFEDKIGLLGEYAKMRKDEIKSAIIQLFREEMETARDASFEKLVVMREYLDAFRKEFKEQIRVTAVDVSLGSIEKLISKKGLEKIRTLLSSSSLGSTTFAAIEKTRVQAAIESKELHDLVVQEIIRRLELAAQLQTDREQSQKEKNAALLIQERYGLAQDPGVIKAWQRYIPNDYQQVLLELTESIVHRQAQIVPAKLRQQLFEPQNKFHIPFSAIQDAVVHGLERYVTAELEKSVHAETLVRVIERLKLFALSFNEARKLNFLAEFKALENRIEILGQKEIRRLLFSLPADGEFQAQLDLAKKLGRVLGLELKDLKEIALEVAQSLKSVEKSNVQRVHLNREFKLGLEA